MVAASALVAYDIFGGMEESLFIVLLVIMLAAGTVLSTFVGKNGWRGTLAAPHHSERFANGYLDALGERDELRQERDFAGADAIRDELLGLLVQAARAKRRGASLAGPSRACCAVASARPPTSRHCSV